MDIKTLIAVFGLPAIGAAIDSWLRTTEKEKLYEWLTQFYVNLEEFNFKEIVNKTAKVYLQWFTFKNTAILSVVATFLSTIICFGVYENLAKDFLKDYRIYVVQLAFSPFLTYLSISITRFFVLKIAKKTSLVTIIFFSCLDIFFFCVIYYYGFVFGLYLVFTLPSDDPFDYKMFNLESDEIMTNIILISVGLRTGLTTPALIYSLPTIAFWLFLYITVVTGVFFFTLKPLMLRWIDVSTSSEAKDFKPFTLIGVLFSPVTIILKVYQ